MSGWTVVYSATVQFWEDASGLQRDPCGQLLHQYAESTSLRHLAVREQIIAFCYNIMLIITYVYNVTAAASLNVKYARVFISKIRQCIQYPLQSCPCQA